MSLFFDLLANTEEMGGNVLQYMQSGANLIWKFMPALYNADANSVIWIFFWYKESRDKQIFIHKELYYNSVA
jgi:hypothetical protein